MALAVVATRIVIQLEVIEVQLSLLAVYSLSAAIGYFFIDRTAGVFLALIGVIYVSHMTGFIAQYPKVIVAEVVFVIGAFTIGYIGPTGGKLAFHRGSWGIGFSRLVDYALGRTAGH